MDFQCHIWDLSSVGIQIEYIWDFLHNRALPELQDAKIWYSVIISQFSPVVWHRKYWLIQEKNKALYETTQGYNFLIKKNLSQSILSCVFCGG